MSIKNPLTPAGIEPAKFLKRTGIYRLAERLLVSQEILRFMKLAVFFPHLFVSLFFRPLFPSLSLSQFPDSRAYIWQK